MKSDKEILHAYYDFRLAPLSFDFLTYLCILKGFFANSRYDDLVLSIIRTRYRKTNHIELSYGPGYEDRKLLNVIISLVSLSFIKNYNLEYSISSRSCESIFPIGYRPENVISDSPLSLMPATINHLIDLYDNSSGSPRFLDAVMPSEKTLRFVEKLGKFVTLTNRFTPHSPVRNGDHKNFFSLYTALSARFKDVKIIFIPDQDDFFGDGDYSRYNWEVFLPASFDLDLRLALYHRALCNITWTGGLGSMLYLSTCPYLLFGIHNESDIVSSERFFNRKGPPFKKQLPWSRKESQIIDWTPAPELTLDYMTDRSIQLVESRLNSC
jgi:hypothetical protein